MFEEHRKGRAIMNGGLIVDDVMRLYEIDEAELLNRGCYGVGGL